MSPSGRAGQYWQGPRLRPRQRRARPRTQAAGPRHARSIQAEWSWQKFWMTDSDNLNVFFLQPLVLGTARLAARSAHSTPKCGRPRVPSLRVSSGCHFRQWPAPVPSPTEHLTHTSFPPCRCYRRQHNLSSKIIIVTPAAKHDPGHRRHRIRAGGPLSAHVRSEPPA